MRRLLLPAAAFIAFLLPGCVAGDDADDDVAQAADAIDSAVCRLGGYRAEPTTRLPLEQSTASMQKIVDAANARARARGDKTRYTLEDFGPYAHFTMELEGPTDRDVPLKIAIRHTMPDGKRSPTVVGWSGMLAKGTHGEIPFELYYDAERYGLGPQAPRFGRHHGFVDALCEGTRSSLAYSFVHRR